MVELLAPAGSLDAFMAAIVSGADAIYLGMNRFGARAYAENFTTDSLREAIKFAHLRNVRVYVTLNTIVFDSEFTDVFNQIDELYLIGVDGIIVQDLAIIDYIFNNYPDMEIHASTQMGIDDIDSVNFCKEFKMSRVVLSREKSIEDINMIKKATKMPVEVFIHGALCVSYSGNCLMSGLIGDRSGNRGRCVSSCRKLYELVDQTSKMNYGKSYILSMKELNTINNIEELKGLDSLKIEGRMKDSAYVLNVVSAYRGLLDNKKLNIKEVNYKLSKTMNRIFTKGFLFNEKKEDIVNFSTPNHAGELIGKVIRKNGNKITLQLEKPLNQNDQILINTKNTEVSFFALQMYDLEMNYINHADKKCIIELKEDVLVGDLIYRVKDFKYEEALKQEFKKKYPILPLDFYIYARVGEKLKLTVSYNEIYSTNESELVIEKSDKNPADYYTIRKQLDRLNDTPYKIGKIDLDIDKNIFIPSSKLNELRRDAINQLDEIRLGKRFRNIVERKNKKPLFFLQESPNLSVYCETEEQYNAAVELGVPLIYYNNKISRNDAIYNENLSKVLVGGYNGLMHYKGKDITTDYSLNVVNSTSVYLLHSMGANKVTLSYEISKDIIEDLFENYKSNYGGYPNTEVIVYGHSHLMEMKYCPLKSKNLCGICKKNQFILKDEVSFFPILTKSDCKVEILNGKILNLIDDLSQLKHVSSFRIQLSIEDYSKSKEIINMFKNKMNGDKLQYFNGETDTRGNFHKDII